MPKKMTELEKRRQRTQEFLNELGVKMPIVKFSTPTKEADLINNKNFISVASEIIFDKVMDSAMNEPKLHTAVFKNSFKRKFLCKTWAKTKLPMITNSIYAEVINTLQDTIIVDSLEGEEKEWLDVDYPLYMVCDSKYFQSNFWEFRDQELKSIEVAAQDFIDYTSLLVCKYIFSFTRDLDDSSKEQILGNIGGLDDIRNAVKITFLGKLLSYSSVLAWYDSFLKHYEVCILLGKDEFEKGVSKIEEMPRSRSRNRKEKIVK